MWRKSENSSALRCPQLGHRPLPLQLKATRVGILPPAVPAGDADKSVGENPAFQEAFQDTLDYGPPIPVAMGVPIIIDSDEPFQMVQDDAIERGLVGTPRLIGVEEWDRKHGPESVATVCKQPRDLG